MSEEQEPREALEAFLEEHPEVLRELDTDLIELCRELDVI